MGASGSDADSHGQSPRDIAELVRSVATVMHQADVSELDLDIGNLKLRLRRPARTSNGGSETLPWLDTASERAPIDEHFITAPMIGTYYAAATPGTPPFVVVGDPVQVGQPI